MNKPLEGQPVLDNPAHRFTPSSKLSTGGVSLEPYRSAAFFEQEREKIFRRAWLVIGRQEEIPKPGDFMVRDVEIGNTSILVTRTDDGSIKAFHNVCSHRSATLVMEREGCAKRFSCPYHKWTYSNTGDLLGIPDQASFFNVDKKLHGLTAVAADVWEGFIFINLAPQPEVGLLEYLGPMADYMAKVPFKSADNHFVVQAEIKANWKVVSDAFLESYHIPSIHPQTIGATFSSKDNPFAHLLDARLLGTHAFVSMYGNPGFQLEEKHKIDRVAQKLEGSGNVISAAKAEDVADFTSHPAVNPTKSASWSMDSAHLFPHTHINMGPGGFWLHQFWPLAVDRTRHTVRFYMGKPTNIRERLQQELYVARVMEVIAEDISNMERTQRGISSGAKQFMPLQDNEIAIRNCVNNVQRWVAASRVREAITP